MKKFVFLFFLMLFHQLPDCFSHLNIKVRPASGEGFCLLG